jgi:glucose/arabinose dehydrogenase
VQLTTAPGESAARFFVIRQMGEIYVFENDVRLPGPFLSLSSKLVVGTERGLLGLAFHPDYQQNGYFYVNYTELTAGSTVIERYSVDPLNPDAALPGSGLIILTIPQPTEYHNAGWIGFGPDGYLYIPLGDGGDGGARAQDGNDLLGKVLRIDVDNPSGGLNYGIPPSNPFVNDPNVLDEIWALGLRNPWRSDFDAFNGNLWIADVGDDMWEEVDFLPAGVGGINLGWRTMEGSHCYSPPVNCNQTGLTLPVFDYDHAGPPARCSVIGGALYRGRQMADMHARFFFTDWCSGQTWSVRQVGGAASDLAEHTTELLRSNGSQLAWCRSISEDANGEIYILGDRSEIYRVVPRGLRTHMPHLTAGAAASIKITGGTAAGMTGLFYSVNGLGSTPFGPAQVTLGIKNAQLLGVRTADGTGVATFNGTVPAGLQNRTLWMQAAQIGVTSNIGIDTID